MLAGIVRTNTLTNVLITPMMEIAQIWIIKIGWQKIARSPAECAKQQVTIYLKNITIVVIFVEGNIWHCKPYTIFLQNVVEFPIPIES